MVRRLFGETSAVKWNLLHNLFKPPPGHQPGNLACLITLFLVAASPYVCNAADKNGVSPNTISLPAGPGSIEGLGASFQPLLNTGTARYMVPLKVPAGTAGHTPALSLDYESGRGNGPLGMGWQAGPVSIKRETDKGIPRYVDGPNGLDDNHDGVIDDAREPDRFTGIEDEELIQLADGSFRSRIAHNFTRYSFTGGHWTAQLKNGARLDFGISQQGRLTDTTGTRVFEWLMEKNTDTSGNVIEYSYVTFPEPDSQKYISEIRYGPGAPPWAVFYFISFTYEPRSDCYTDYRSGFPVTTTMRLKEIVIGIQGILPEQCARGDWNHDNIPDALIRKYVLAYQETPNASFLSRVTQYGADGTNYLPPISFYYSIPAPEDTMSAAGAVVESLNTPDCVMDNGLTELIDLNRDGLPDILKTDIYGGSHACFVNLGEMQQGNGPAIAWAGPVEVTGRNGLAQQLQLNDQYVYLADMNGDGISDLVHNTYSSEVFYHPNTGNNSWGARTRMSIQESAPPAPYASEDVVTSDLDFNKRMDVIKSSDSGYSVWFNLEDGRYSKEVRTPGASYQGRVIRFSDSGVHLADMNGDRLNDVVRIRPTRVICCPSMGHGYFDTAVEIPIPDSVLTSQQAVKAKIVDINGDGLGDLVLERAIPGQLWYWLNQHGTEFSAKHVITHMPTQFSPGMVTRWADINGNGTTDLIYADSASQDRIIIIDAGKLMGAVHANLLTGIDNGLGVFTEITYRSSTEFYLQARRAGHPWSCTIPFPVSLVARVTVHTGLDLDGVPGDDTYIKSYSYRDGFYEDRERAFRGFSEVTVTEEGGSTEPSGVTTYRFFTGGPDGIDNDADGQVDEVSTRFHREEDALKGKVREIIVSDLDGTLFWREQNLWSIKNLALGLDGEEVRFAFNQQATRHIFEGTATPETIRTTFAYDDFGNITEKRNEGALSIPGDETFTFTEYINDTSRWLLGLPRHRYVTDAGLNRLSETFFYYDGQPYTGLAQGQATRGMLSRKEGWVQGSTYVNLARNAYDTFGNLIGTMDANGNLRLVSYDAAMHLFPIAETIKTGTGKPDLTVLATYNPGLGVMTESTGFNSHKTTYSYDTFGRLTSVVRPGDVPEYPTKAFTYTLTDPLGHVTYSYDASGNLTKTTGTSPAPSAVKTSAREVSGQPGTFDSILYIDGMGRRLATIQEAESGFVARDAVLFNTRGDTARRFLPYPTTSPDFTPPDPGFSHTEIHRDATGREILRINPPDAGNVTTRVTTSYMPLSKKVTDENGRETTFLSDGRKLTVEVRKQVGGEAAITRYSYDALGNLVQVMDAQNNTWTYEYDGLSRKRATNDPDRGRMEYTYDAAGNIIQSIDNKGQVITYTYDGANRILTEDYLDGASRSPDIAFHYDQPSPDYPDSANTMGRLSWVEDLSGATYFSYDAAGNTAWTVKRIKDAGQVQDFLSQFRYDAMRRLVSATFPDGDTISYAYNNGGRLESIPGVITDIDHAPSGKPQAVIFGNGLRTTYSYDPRNRLKGLVTDRLIPSGSPLQALSYTFDGVSNVLSIQDGRPWVQGLPQDATQEFTYDELNRLIRAQGPGYGAINFQYDKIGNMTFKGSPDMPDPLHIDNTLINLGTISNGGSAGTSGRGPRPPGAPPGPHAVTATQSGLAFSYDDNGNLVSDNNGTYQWDFKDRLTRAATTGVTISNVYDYQGRRVIKKVQGGTSRSCTYYINRGYQVRDGKPVKFVFDQGRRLARIEGKLSAQQGSATQTINLRRGWNFFSLNVEPYHPAIQEVLASLAGKYSGIWTYDAASSRYLGYIPSQGVTDIQELHPGQGYLIHMDSPAIINVNGAVNREGVNLSTGWNLAPFPADSPLPLPKALKALNNQYMAAWYFEPCNQSWQSYHTTVPPLLNTLDHMEPGRSYWINMLQPAQLPFMEAGAKLYFYHTDHLGGTSMITDENGTVVEQTQYYPFGLTRFHAGASRALYKFAGMEMDRAPGLYHCRARHYSAITGTFMSVDPFPVRIEHPGTLNAYTYANNNPLVFVDPWGLDPDPAQDIKDPGSQAKNQGNEPGSSWDQLKDDLRKALLALALNALQSAFKEAGVGDVAKYVTGGLGLGIMGYEAFESGDWEKKLEFSLGAVETGFAVFGGKKLALLEAYHYGKGIYEMGKTAIEAASSNTEGAMKYAAVKAGMEIYNKGPEGALKSFLSKITPPQLWGEAQGPTPMWNEAQGRAREFINPYLEEVVGYIPLLTQEEQSMVTSATQGIIY